VAIIDRAGAGAVGRADDRADEPGWRAEL